MSPAPAACATERSAGRSFYSAAGGMIRIAITAAAFEAIAATLPLGSVGYENKINERGERLIWLEPTVVDRLRSLRGPGKATAT